MEDLIQSVDVLIKWICDNYRQNMADDDYNELYRLKEDLYHIIYLLNRINDRNKDKN